MIFHQTFHMASSFICLHFLYYFKENVENHLPDENMKRSKNKVVLPCFFFLDYRIRTLPRLQLFNYFSCLHHYQKKYIFFLLNFQSYLHLIHTLCLQNFFWLFDYWQMIDNFPFYCNPQGNLRSILCSIFSFQVDNVSY